MIRQTSIDTYNEIKENGLLSKLRFLVYDCLYKYGPKTQMEICKQINSETIQDRSLMPRFAELLDQGVIAITGVRQCSVTGRSVTEWDVTSSLPLKSIKKNKMSRSEILLKDVFSNVSPVFLGQKLYFDIEQYLKKFI